MSYNNCSESYVGISGLYLKTNDCKPTNSGKIVLINHYLEKDHKFRFNKSIILAREITYKKRMFLEIIYINLDKNSVNFRTDTQNWSFFYSGILEKI